MELASVPGRLRLHVTYVLDWTHREAPSPNDDLRKQLQCFQSRGMNHRSLSVGGRTKAEREARRLYLEEWYARVNEYA